MFDFEDIVCVGVVGVIGVIGVSVVRCCWAILDF